MRASIWYRTEEKNPDKSGYYLSYRGWGMGGKADGDSDWGYMYYDKKHNSWRDYKGDQPYGSAIVYYWTDATPDEWTDQDPPSIVLHKQKQKYSVTLDDAWKKVVEAVDQYNMLRELTK